MGGCSSCGCKIDLVTVKGRLEKQKNQDFILDGFIVPHFDNHVLARRPVFMDMDNARPHRAGVRFESNAIETLLRT